MYNVMDFIKRLFKGTKEAEPPKPYTFMHLTVNFIIDDNMPDTDIYSVEYDGTGNLTYRPDSIGHIVEHIIENQDAGMFDNHFFIGYQCNTDVYYHVIGMYNYMTKGEMKLDV